MSPQGRHRELKIDARTQTGAVNDITLTNTLYKSTNSESTIITHITKPNLTLFYFSANLRLGFLFFLQLQQLRDFFF